MFWFISYSCLQIWKKRCKKNWNLNQRINLLVTLLGAENFGEQRVPLLLLQAPPIIQASLKMDIKQA